MGVRDILCSSVSLIVAFVLCALLNLVGAPAVAQTDCAAAAEAFMRGTSDRLLSVSSRGDQCVVTYLMHRRDKRPIRVSQDLSLGRADILQAGDEKDFSQNNNADE